MNKDKKQQILLIITLGILIITAVFLYFSFWSNKSTSIPEEIAAEEKQDNDKIYTERALILLEERLKKIKKLDFEFLNENILSFLKKHGDFPLRQGETGRINPFISY